MSILTQAAVIAAIVWGTVPECSAVQQQFATLGRGVLGQTDGACTILYNRRRAWPWGQLCTTTIHEWGHLTSHLDHSPNPRSVMYYRFNHVDRRCADYGGPYISTHRCRDPRLTYRRKALGCPTVRATLRIVGRTPGLAIWAIRTATALDRTLEPTHFRTSRRPHHY